eukprot:TRINITY_DN22311_c0_g1_i1.p2 TRINITY_DN22311_c0_g1~~TRINITY_DN22311_c0_g1_i1.p2  ORF type:complete len:120 (-),score=30.44 TRINITY_DN22311_c0_g1_i1:466-825(-)
MQGTLASVQGVLGWAAQRLTSQNDDCSPGGSDASDAGSDGSSLGASLRRASTSIAESLSSSCSSDSLCSEGGSRKRGFAGCESMASGVLPAAKKHILRTLDIRGRYRLVAVYAAEIYTD